MAVLRMAFSSRYALATVTELTPASSSWGLTMTADGLRLLQDLRRSLLEPPAQLRPPTVATARPTYSPETVSTVA